MRRSKCTRFLQGTERGCIRLCWLALTNVGELHHIHLHLLHLAWHRVKVPVQVPPRAREEAESSLARVHPMAGTIRTANPILTATVAKVAFGDRVQMLLLPPQPLLLRIRALGMAPASPVTWVELTAVMRAKLRFKK
jgi:hypothetical protein